MFCWSYLILIITPMVNSLLSFKEILNALSAKEILI